MFPVVLVVPSKQKVLGSITDFTKKVISCANMIRRNLSAAHNEALELDFL